MRVYGVNDPGIRHGEAIPVKPWARELGTRSFRRVSWGDGTQRKRGSRLAFRRVVAATAPRKEAVWLAMAWLPDESEPTQFDLVTGAPGCASLARRTVRR